MAASDMGAKWVNFKINFEQQNTFPVTHLHFIFAKTVPLSKQALMIEKCIFPVLKITVGHRILSDST